MEEHILFKLATRSRPEKARASINNIIENCTSDNFTILVSADFDDDSMKNFSYVHSNVTIIYGISKSKIDAINRDINDYHSNWDILVNISDDQLAERKGWDSIIKDVMTTDLDASLWFNDGWQDRINTMEIVGKEYYKRFNYIYYPEYKSFYCDNEATEIAMQLGKCIQSKECIIRHYHYGWMPNSHMKKDDTYIKAELNWEHDKELYKQRKAKNYQL